MDLSDIRTDSALEQEGVWRPYMGAEFKIASANNPKYLRAIRRHVASIPASKAKDPAHLDPLIAKALAETVLLEWRGEVKDAGKQLVCNAENKLKLCNIRAFREWLAAEASDLANFQTEAAAEEIETLKKP